MAYESECRLSEIVTSFLLKTCPSHRRLREHDIRAVMLCAEMASKRTPDIEEGKHIPLITGSYAEFYIEPMLPHFGDIDVMYYYNTQLAIPQGHPPPTQLPAEFHSYVKAFEIIDSHLPAYVYLLIRYLLTQRIDDNKYEYFEYERKPYFGNDSRFSRGDGPTRGKMCYQGPALTGDCSDIPGMMSCDYVRCVHCLVWPPQAAGWTTRHRNYGWPDSATFDRVVSNGCDVVGVAHHQCKEDKWMRKAQHRMSFSRAEIVLMNSWMPVQQIVYHVLRVYLKTELLSDHANKVKGASLPSNYHIKTLVLWACELKPKNWWTENLNLVSICVELLNTLSVWLTDTRCPHYFVDNCNLLDKSFNVGRMASQLKSVNDQYLSTWLVKNYIGQCAKLCPGHISHLFDDVSTAVKLRKAVSEIVRWRLSDNFAFDDVCWTVSYAESKIPLFLSYRHILTVHSCIHWMNALKKIDKRISVYFSAVALLHVAGRISIHGFNDELMDILSLILGRDSNVFCGVLSLCKAELNTPELVELLQKFAAELLTAHRQLVARDLGSFGLILTIDFEELCAYKRGV